MQPVLFSAKPSPFVRKVRVVALETGQMDQITEEFGPMVAPSMEPGSALVAQNPLGKIPTMATEEGPLMDSRVICEYLDSRHSGPSLFGAGSQRWERLRLQAIADGIMDAAVLVRYEMAMRPEALHWQAWLDGQMGKVARSLGYFESVRDRFDGFFDIGQIAVGCALGYLDFRFADQMDWRKDCPGLAGWFEGVMQRESMQRTVPEAPPPA